MVPSDDCGQPGTVMQPRARRQRRGQRDRQWNPNRRPSRGAIRRVLRRAAGRRLHRSRRPRGRPLLRDRCAATPRVGKQSRPRAYLRIARIRQSGPALSLVVHSTTLKSAPQDARVPRKHQPPALADVRPRGRWGSDPPDERRLLLRLAKDRRRDVYAPSVLQIVANDSVVGSSDDSSALASWDEPGLDR